MIHPSLKNDTHKPSLNHHPMNRGHRDRSRISHLAVSRAECRKYIQHHFHKDRFDLDPLYNLQFLTITDISTSTHPRLIGRLRLTHTDSEMWYIITTQNRRITLHLIPKHTRHVTQQLALPLSMDVRAPSTIYIPPSFSKTVHIPNEVTWEFLSILYTKFPTL